MDDDVMEPGTDDDDTVLGTIGDVVIVAGATTDDGFKGF